MKKIFFICLVMLLSVVQGKDALTFDCATPIILGPILQYMRENIDEKTEENNILNVSRTIQNIFSLSRISPSDEEKLPCECILEIAYDFPNRNIFRLYYDTGFIVMIRHIDNKGNVIEYTQTIKSQINQMHFEDVDYENLSKDCLMKIYMWESPFGYLPDGKHKVTVNYKFKDYLGIGSVTFQEAALEYKFSYHNGKVNNAALKSSLNKILIYSITLSDGKVKCANVLDNSPKRSGFDCIFHDDLGVRMYSQMDKGKQERVTIWGRKGKEKAIYDFNDWINKGMPLECKSIK